MGWRSERSTLCNCVKIEQTHFKIVRLTTIRNGSKWTISVNSELWLLQIVPERDTERCANEDADP